MTLVITEPIKTVNGLLTEALAARTQLLYEVQREDFAIIQVLAGPSRVRVSGNQTALIAPGDNLYLFFDGPRSDLNGFHVVDTVTFNTPNTDLTFLTIPDGSDDTGYANNLTAKIGYRIEIEVQDDTGAALFETIFKYVPNQAGFVNIDVQALLSFYLSAPSTFTFSKLYRLAISEVWNAGSEAPVITSVLQAVLASKQLLQQGGANMWENLLREGGGAASFIYPGQGTPIELPSANRVWSTLNSTQAKITLQASVDPSLSLATIESQQLVKEGATVTISLKAEILVGTFTAIGDLRADLQGRIPGGAAFDIKTNVLRNVTSTTGFIQVTWDEEITLLQDTDRLAFRVITTSGDFVVSFDIDTSRGHYLNITTTPTAQLLTRFDNPKKWLGWNRTVSALVDQEFTPRTTFGSMAFYATETDINKVNIVGQVIQGGSEGNPTVHTVPIKEPTNADSAFIAVSAKESTPGAVNLSEIVYYEIQNECDNPVMIDWINTLGGVDQWLFERKQTIIYESGEGVTAERPITTDVEFVTRTKQRFPGPSVQKMTLEAKNLTEDQLQALQEIKQTSSLRVYLSKDGANFIDAVVVNDFTSNLNTKINKQRFVLMIEFPDDFDFLKGKLY